MARVFLSEDLINIVKNRASVSGTIADGSDDQDILDFLNEELLYEIAPHMMNTREEYFVVTGKIPLVANQTAYRLPERAMGQKLRKAKWIDQDDPRVRDDLTCISPDDVAQYEASNRITRPQAFYIEGNYMVLIPNIGAAPNGIIEASYFFRPGKMVLAANYRKVLTVTPATNTITVDSTPPTSWVTGVLFDIHAGVSGAEVKSFSNLSTSIVGSTIILTDAIDGSIAGTRPVEIGDYIAIEEEAAAPMGLPTEAMPVLAQAATTLFMEQHGDEAELKMHEKRLDRNEKRLDQLLNVRVEGQPKKITNRNSLWRSSRRRWRR